MLIAVECMAAIVHACFGIPVLVASYIIKGMWQHVTRNFFKDQIEVVLRKGMITCYTFSTNIVVFVNGMMSFPHSPIHSLYI